MATRQRRAAGVAATPTASAGSSDIIETARSKRPRFKDERVTMAHGAGGKATQTLIEGLLVPAFSSGTLDEMADAGTVAVDGLGLALTTDTFVVKPIRFPGGSIGELAVNGTVNDLAAAGAEPLAISVSLVLEEGLPTDDLRAEVEAIAAAAKRGRRGDRHRGHQGRRARELRRDVRLHHGRRPDRPTGDALPCLDPARRPGAVLGNDRRARHGHHAGPRASSASTPGSNPTPGRCGRRRTRSSMPPGLRSAACATRRAVAWRRSSTSWRAPPRPRSRSARRTSPCGPRCRRGGDPRDRPDVRRQRGRVGRVRRPEAADDALAALRAVPGHEAAAEIGVAGAEPPGMVLVETAFGGRRVMDLLAGDPLPRIC